MSKVGAKHAALACDLAQFLPNFDETDDLSEQDDALAKSFLVHAWVGVQ